MTRRSRFGKRQGHRSERVELRVSPEQKMYFVRAAELRGQSLTEFAVDSMHKAAVQTAEDQHVLRLGAEESRVFIDAILNPPTPNHRLTRAAKRYDQVIVRR